MTRPKSGKTDPKRRYKVVDPVRHASAVAASKKGIERRKELAAQGKLKTNTIPIHVWDAMYEFFRENPGRVKAAAEHVGVSRPTAHRAWHNGYESLDDFRNQPMKHLLNTEQKGALLLLHDEMKEAIAAEAAGLAETEAAIQERIKEEAAKQREAMIRNRKEEAKMVRAVRGNVIKLIETLEQSLEGAMKRAPQLKAFFESGKDGTTEIPLKDYMQMLWQLGRLLNQATAAGAEAVRLDRLLLGEPTDIVELRETDDVTVEQALADIDDTARAAQRFRVRRERKLRLVANGGVTIEGDDEAEDEGDED